MDYKGMTALVTGASAGLGEEFARQLASRGCNLILVARSEGKLAKVAAELRQRWKTEVAVMPADLASAEAVQRLIAEIKSRGTNVGLLVNNAGFGIFDNFLDAPLQRQMEQVDVNVRALVTLTHCLHTWHGHRPSRRGHQYRVQRRLPTTSWRRRLRRVEGFRPLFQRRSRPRAGEEQRSGFSGLPRTRCNAVLREHESPDAGKADGSARHYRSRNTASLRQRQEGRRSGQVAGSPGNARGAPAA
jgi:short chain dehydrogenase